MTKILSNETINKGRQIELDLARGLAVFFMILIHTQENFSSDIAKSTILGRSIEFLGGIPAAPVFMFLLGVGIVYSNKSKPIEFIKKGLLLILAGYLLNILRGLLPNIFRYIVLNDASYLTYGLNQLIYIDIFQFAGLSMIFFGLVKKLNLKPFVIILCLLGFAISGFLLSNVTTENYLLSAVTGLIWGSNKLSFFPFFIWIFYPLAGYIWGNYLIRCLNKNNFYLVNGIISLAIMSLFIYIFSYLLHIDIGLSTSYGYYHHNIIGNIVFTTFVILWISILFFFSKQIPNFILKFIQKWSKNVSEIYFIHWVLIGWLVILTGENKFSLLYYLIIFAIIFIISNYLADYYNICNKSNKQEISSYSKDISDTKEHCKLKLIIYFGAFVIMITTLLLTICVISKRTVSQSDTAYVKNEITNNSIKNQINDIKIGGNVLVYDVDDNLWYPAIVVSIKNDQYSVKYYDTEIKEDVVDCDYIRPENLSSGMTVKIYNDKNELVDALIIERNDKKFIIQIDGENEIVDIGKIIVSNKKS